LQQKQKKLYDSWIAKLRDNSKIKIAANF